MKKYKIAVLDDYQNVALDSAEWSALRERADFHILVTVFFFGFALLLGILSVMRGLYAFSTFQPPLIPSDSAAKVSLDDGHEQPHLSWSTGGLTPDRDFDHGT